MAKNGDKKMLSGIGEIIAYLECTKPTFYEFIRIGLPARLHRKKWYAHKDNIDDFFRRFTIADNRNLEIPEDAE